ncbi:LOW QUALITY PROTEIN: E3 UFM1-protein ligase 1 [Ctenopharyngodon idella]|uniref:LOW QUALITY PROTEIN: E3 UFM1-protein ligase 1 n=1 Tax=Ctenopharyngodon idella TaxID=7959 RepID=UPI0022326899|nr:LOW QUALITY PROTEIN: E3 UFM1-protein ligase 1 [Ctenopharyngodon idella]
MAADWEEIRRLAADFQRAQFADTVQRLSERNCIEIVAKLVLDKKLDVVHTLDGKEYVTPAQISREMRDELYMQRGRINVVDLQKIINVDLVHVEGRANEIAKSDKGTQLILGQLIEETYLDQLAEEVNDKLQEAGQVNIAELCKTYDLPGDFLTEELNARLGRVIQGQIDQYNRGVIFTQAFVSRHKACICGLFSAITRPTQISNLINLYGFQENLLYSVLEELVDSGRLKGSVVGGRQDKAIYIPDIYSKAQSTWVDSFLKQNGYLEFEALTRLGIPDPVSYIKKRFKSSKLLFLKSLCVGRAIVDQLEASVEEAISSATWVDLQPMLPSSLSEEDVGILLNEVLRAMNVQSSARLLSTSVVSEKFISGCLTLFDDIMQQKAQKEVKNNPVFLITEEDVKQASVLLESSASSKKDKRDERRKKAAEGSGSVKGGGCGNAREIRIRKTKKKGRREEDSDEETSHTSQGRNKLGDIAFLSVEEIMEVLEQRVCDSSEEMLQELAEQLLRPLSKMYQEVVSTAFLSTSSTGAGGSRKKNMKDLQEEINNLYNNIRLFEKGTKLFSDETQATIARHVLKTLCTDVTNVLLSFVAAEHMTSDSSTAITSEIRLKILAKLSDEVKSPLMKLHNSLNGKVIEEFLSCLETSAEECGLLLKKGDKKRERQALFVHRQALLEQLRDTEDPALVLHLTSVLLFQNITHCMLHAPGRCVPHIIGFLQSKIPEDQHKLLSQYQSLVVKQLVVQSHGLEKNSNPGQGVEDGPVVPDDVDGLQKELHSLTRDIKDIILTQKKPSVTE